MKKEELEASLISQDIGLDAVKIILEMCFSTKIGQRETELTIPAVDLKRVNERFVDVLRGMQRVAFIKIEDGGFTSFLPVFQSIRYTGEKELVIYSLNEKFKAWAGLSDFWLVRKPQHDQRFH